MILLCFWANKISIVFVHLPISDYKIPNQLSLKGCTDSLLVSKPAVTAVGTGHLDCCSEDQLLNIISCLQAKLIN